MVNRVYSFINNLVEQMPEVSNLLDCHAYVAEHLTASYVSENFPEVTVTDSLLEKLQTLWRDTSVEGVFRYCCGTPILYTESMFDVGKAAIDRLSETLEILEEGGLRYDNG